MRIVISLVAALFFAAPAFAEPPKPTVVIQTKPVARLLAEFREMTRQVAGPVEADRLVKEFDAGLKEALGEQGFEGIDINRPLVAYGVLSDDIKDASLVIAVPVTGEMEFLSFLKRLKLQGEPIKDKKGVYKLVIPLGGIVLKDSYVQFVGGWAYVCVNAGKPIEANNLIPIAELIDNTDPSLALLKLYPGRVPEKFVKKYLDELEQGAAGIKGFIGGGAPKHMVNLMNSFFDDGPKLVRRYAETGLKEAAEVGLRFGWDPATGDTVSELTIVPKAGTGLAKGLAAMPATSNRFANLIPKDAAVGLVIKAPLFATELRTLATAAIEAGQAELKTSDLPNSFHAVLDELAKQLTGSVKKGELDGGIALLGPDKDGKYTVLGGVTLEETAALDKALRVAAKPADLAKHFQFDVDKVGDVSIHKVPLGRILPAAFADLTDEIEKLFGKDAPCYLAFANDAVFIAYGPESLMRIKAAIDAKPGPAPVLDATGNMSRIHKLLAIVGDESVAALFAKHVGTVDKPVNLLRVTVDGGAKLSVKATLNLRYLPKVIVIGDAIEGNVKPPPP